MPFASLALCAALLYLAVLCVARFPSEAFKSPMAHRTSLVPWNDRGYEKYPLVCIVTQDTNDRMRLVRDLQKIGYSKWVYVDPNANYRPQKKAVSMVTMPEIAQIELHRHAYAIAVHTKQSVVLIDHGVTINLSGFVPGILASANTTTHWTNEWDLQLATHCPVSVTCDHSTTSNADSDPFDCALAYIVRSAAAAALLHHTRQVDGNIIRTLSTGAQRGAFTFSTLSPPLAYALHGNANNESCLQWKTIPVRCPSLDNDTPFTT